MYARHSKKSWVYFLTITIGVGGLDGCANLQAKYKKPWTNESITVTRPDGKTFTINRHVEVIGGFYADRTANYRSLLEGNIVKHWPDEEKADVVTRSDGRKIRVLRKPQNPDALSSSYVLVPCKILTDKEGNSLPSNQRDTIHFFYYNSLLDTGDKKFLVESDGAELYFTPRTDGSAKFTIKPSRLLANNLALGIYPIPAAGYTQTTRNYGACVILDSAGNIISKNSIDDFSEKEAVSWIVQPAVNLPIYAAISGPQIPASARNVPLLNIDFATSIRIQDLQEKIHKNPDVLSSQNGSTATIGMWKVVRIDLEKAANSR